MSILKTVFARGRGTVLVAACLLACAAFAGAAPFEKRVRFTQPDGAVIELQGRGDEFYAVFETLDGYTVAYEPAARAYCYARLEAGRLVSTGQWAGRGQPAGLALHLRESDAARRAQAVQRRQAWEAATGVSQRWEALKASARAREEAARAGAQAAPPWSPTVGVKVGLCLLVDFTDAPSTVPQAGVASYLNGDNYQGYGNAGSVKEYFQEVSNGKLTYTNVVTAYVRAPKPKSFYNDTSEDCGTNASRLITDVLGVLKASPNYTTQVLPLLNNLTVDGNNQVVACNVFYAGDNGGVWMYGLWPHSWSLPEGPQELSPGGKKISNYQVTDIGDQLAIGTFCHENGHMLCDFPDIYDYDYDSIGGAGYFCLMNSGAFPLAPVQVSAYLKLAAGWATAIDINSASSLTAVATAAPGTNFNVFYRYQKPGVRTEYFLAENRQQTGRDAGIPGAGIAVWHVDELGDRDNQSLLPNLRHANYEVTLVQADNLWHFEHNVNEGDSRDLYFQDNTAAGYNNRLSDSTAPSAHWWDGSSSGLVLTRFSTLGSTMTYVVGEGAAPVITLRPSSLLAMVGSTVTLRVGASGSPPLSYQWRKDGVNLANGGRFSGATNDTLVFTNAAMADSGTYSVLVRNPFGSVASAGAGVTVVSPPEILRHPQSQWASAGAVVRMRVQAGGAAPLYYQWLKDGVPLAEGPRRAGVAQSVLTISGLTPGDAGSYVVTISNPYGLETSRAAQLTVLPAGNGVGIASTNGWNGADAAWPFGETETATFGQTFVAPTDSRVVSFTLYLAAANDPDPVDFKFYLMAWDGAKAAGPVLYASAPTAAGDPAMRAYSFRPPGLSLVAGAEYVAFVSASGLFNGQAGHASAGQVCQGAGDGSFVFLNSRASWSMTTNAAWTATNECQLAFVAAFEGPPEPPWIVPQPLSKAGAAGSVVSLVSGAAGSDPKTLRWWKDGAPLENSGRVSGAASGVLTVAGLTLADAADYVLVASNAYGMATSAVARLTVGDAPFWAVQPQNQKALIGDTAAFSALPGGTPPFSCQWRKDLAPLSGATASWLTLTNVQSGDAAGYSVVVSSPYGSATSSVATLSVRAGVSAGPDAYGYQAAETSPFALEDIQGSGRRILAGADDSAASASLGFAFQFYGRVYTNVFISANGLLTFGAPNAQSLNVNLAAAAPSVNAGHLAVFWDDLVAGSNGVVCQTLGAPGSRRFVALFKDVRGFNSPMPVTFEVSLFEGRNEILAQYLNVNTGDSRAWGAEATVGLRDIDGQKNSRALVWSFNRAALQNEQAIRFFPAGAAAPPVIRSQPAGAVVPSGQPASLTVAAEGPGPLAWQWLKDGQALAGATNATLDIPAAALADAGIYSALVSNTNGWVYSSGAVLALENSPLAFQGARRVDPATLALSWAGPAGKTNVLRVSTDLRHWETLQILTNTTGVVRTTDTNLPSGPRRFYQILQP